MMGEVIGRGGMGEVLLAHDGEIGRDVAYKRLRAATPSEEDVSRFLREARIQARLEHPAIAPVSAIMLAGFLVPIALELAGLIPETGSCATTEF